MPLSQQDNLKVFVICETNARNFVSMPLSQQDNLKVGISHNIIDFFNESQCRSRSKII